MDYSGRWYIDGIDLYTTFSMVMEEGSADFLKHPPKKQSIEHDWQDSHGIDVDLSRMFFQKREGVLRMCIIATSEADFWLKNDAFISLLMQPGLRRLEMLSHNNRSYFIYYQEVNNYSQLAPVTGAGGNYQIVHRFSLVVVEPSPTLYPNNVFLVTEDGKFIIS